MPLNMIAITVVALFDILILLTLFPTPFRNLLSYLIDISDGSNLINFSFVILAVNVLLLIGLLINKWRFGLFDGQFKWLLYSCLTIIVLYTLIGLAALYQMYIVGLH